MSKYVVEYALRMRQFPANSHLLNVNGELICPLSSFEEFGRRLAIQQVTAPASDGRFGTARTQIRLVNETIGGLRELLTTPLQSATLAAIEEFVKTENGRLGIVLTDRFHRGRVRECRGDLHLDNVVFLDQSIRAFDALEFDPDLRFTDVAADVAFFCMDLEAHGFVDQGHRFLQGWLTESGDYEALSVLRYFCIYRALVRARVSRLAASECDDVGSREAYASLGRANLACANRYIEERNGATLYIMRGLSGSGKSWLANSISESLRAIKVSSDTERKRGSTPPNYSGDSREKVYGGLRDAASTMLKNGHTVVLDARHISAASVTSAVQIAHECKSKALVLDVNADHEILEQRIRKRAAKRRSMSDADASVLRRQIAKLKPIPQNHAKFVYAVDTSLPVDRDMLSRNIRWLAREA